MGIGITQFVEAAGKSANEGLRAGAWLVYERYRYVDTGTAVYAERPRLFDAAAREGEDPNYAQPYAPLRLTGLFLEFAELAGQREISCDDWHDWIKRWGVLGVDEKGRHRGGPEESFARFTHEAMTAHEALRLYETGEDPDKLELLVQTRLSKWCHPQLYRDKQTGGWVFSWGFRSLLGAMWMQMAWLMAAPKEDVRRCEWCNRVMDFGPSKELPDLERIGSGRRKPHKPHAHKRFCSDTCRASAHYHAKKGRQGR